MARTEDENNELNAAMMSEEEMRSTVLYNSYGEKLIYAGGGIWTPEQPHPETEEEKAEFDSRFSHPKISVWQTVLQLAIPPAVTAVAAVVLRFTLGRSVAAFASAGWLILMAAGALLLYALIRLRSIIIFAVHVYQVRAPMSVRGRCHMVPTCSDYMILAVRKYGALRGLVKGIKRLHRCDGTYRKDMP